MGDMCVNVCFVSLMGTALLTVGAIGCITSWLEHCMSYCEINDASYMTGLPPATVESGHFLRNSTATPLPSLFG